MLRHETCALSSITTMVWPACRMARPSGCYRLISRRSARLLTLTHARWNFR